MKRFRILIIAPYLSFQETAAPVIQEFPTVDFEMHTGDEFTAISIFNSYPPNAFDAIITRGAIAAILRQFTSVPVVGMYPYWISCGLLTNRDSAISVWRWSDIPALLIPSKKYLKCFN